MERISSISSSGSDSGYSDCSRSNSPSCSNSSNFTSFSSRICSDSILSSRSSNSNSPSLFKGPQNIYQITNDLIKLGYIVEFDDNNNVIKWYKP